MSTSRRFRTAAAHYLAGRPPYAGRLIRRVVDLTGLRPDHAVLDLGCGPGPLARAFAPYAGQVIALDPEPEMLRMAEAAGTPPNVTWREGSSATLGPGLGHFYLVTMGRSFHWMERAETLRRLDAMIPPGGAIALFSDSHPDIPANAWRQDYRAILDRFDAADAVRARRRAGDWVRHEAVLLDSAFRDLEQIAVLTDTAIAAASLIDRALSMSSTSRALLGGAADALVAELEAWLATISPGGTLREVVATTALMARRPQ